MLIFYIFPGKPIEIKTEFVCDKDGRPIFPQVDTRRTPAADIACILGDYFLVIWSRTQGSAKLPWDAIESNPDIYYDSWGFPGKIMQPDRMETMDIINIARHLGGNTFDFFSKERIEKSIQQWDAMYKLSPPPEHKEDQQGVTTDDDDLMAGSHDEEEQLEVTRLSKKRFRSVRSRSRSSSNSRGHSFSRSESRSISCSRSYKRTRTRAPGSSDIDPPLQTVGTPQNGDMSKSAFPDHGGTYSRSESRSISCSRSYKRTQTLTPGSDVDPCLQKLGTPQNDDTAKQASPDHEGTDNNIPPAKRAHATNVQSATAPMPEATPSPSDMTTNFEISSLPPPIPREAAADLLQVTMTDSAAVNAVPPVKKQRGRPRKTIPTVISDPRAEGLTQSTQPSGSRPQRERKVPPVGLTFASNLEKGPQKRTPLDQRWDYVRDED